MGSKLSSGIFFAKAVTARRQNVSKRRIYSPFLSRRQSNQKFTFARRRRAPDQMATGVLKPSSDAAADRDLAVCCAAYEPQNHPGTRRSQSHRHRTRPLGRHQPDRPGHARALPRNLPPSPPRYRPTILRCQKTILAISFKTKTSNPWVLGFSLGFPTYTRSLTTETSPLQAAPQLRLLRGLGFCSPFRRLEGR